MEFGQVAKNSLFKESASYEMLESLWLAPVKTIILDVRFLPHC